jgi:aryl-alcohol dehydrogenase-like predicted oxidoreductase
MKYTNLPNTEIKVSKICLGTMTWGRQNSEAEGHQQMDYALDQGINFFDTAELYPIPPQQEFHALTEKYIGNWFRKTGNRNKIILATKIAGPAPHTKYIRTTGFRPDGIREAVDGSLSRLQTDYIDLYQLHWPERVTNYFGKRGYQYDVSDPWNDNIREVLQTLADLIKVGKIRHVGLSNETPWGVMRYLEEARVDSGLPKMITIQNSYSLLNRQFEVGLSEIAHRENLGLLSYSPLGFGVLSGKYLDGKSPDKARITLFPNYKRYSGEAAVAATAAYNEIANRHGMSLTQMSLAFVNSRPFLTSTIIGATTMEQLKENIGSIELQLNQQLLQEIEEVHNLYPNPAP